LKLSSENIVIGSLGNVRPAKAYDVLVRAAAMVVASNPQVHFVIAGDKKADLMADLEVLMAQLQVSEQMHFIGFLDDSAGFLAQLDMFVLSSSSEGFSISTIEAMATSLPIIATRCGGPEEIVQQGSDALLVDTDDPGALAGAISRLINEPDLARRLREEAKASVNKRFSIEHTLAGYIELYQRVS
jgi:glycosyltransferase involved in cell wall biosynthesis